MYCNTRSENSLISRAVGKDYKGKLSNILYIVAIGFTLYIPLISGFIYIIVALIWLIPDKRIEKNIEKQEQS